MSSFNALFDQWAHSYDETVYGTEHEYEEVFENYIDILEGVCSEFVGKSNGIILDIGTGTGNLAKALSQKGVEVIGIEPSYEMRKKAAAKLPHIPILAGHFLDVPIDGDVEGVVTSYAFHHLTYSEKREALRYLDQRLNKGGKIVIADTMFESEEYKGALMKRVKEQGAMNLYHDLSTEFYEYVEDMTVLFKELGYSYSLKKMNVYVWILSAQKNL